MKTEKITIENIPAVIYGELSQSVYLFVHGKCGCKEEAADFAEYACRKGFQVIGIDLPEHGERKAEKDMFNPWTVVPELKKVMQYVGQRWSRAALRANSIGAWFSMLSFRDEPLEKCLFVSPILDMSRLIDDMMKWASVTEKQLFEQKIIETSFGEALSWRYREYAEQNPITNWKAPTSILYAGQDNLTSRATVDSFTSRFSCKLTVMENGEHRFHTPPQLEVLHEWTESEIEPSDKEGSI